MKGGKPKAKQSQHLLLCGEEAERPTEGRNLLQRNLIMIGLKNLSKYKYFDSSFSFEL